MLSDGQSRTKYLRRSHMSLCMSLSHSHSHSRLVTSLYMIIDIQAGKAESPCLARSLAGLNYLTTICDFQQDQTVMN